MSKIVIQQRKVNCISSIYSPRLPNINMQQLRYLLMYIYTRFNKKPQALHIRKQDLMLQSTKFKLIILK